MFIDTGKVLVNLQNVSNINIIRRSNRIVFNLNYSISLDGMDSRLISDYVYWDSDPNEFLENIELLKSNFYCIDQFFLYKDTMINKNEISSVKFDDSKNRVIFNLSHCVMFTKPCGSRSLTSEFVYLNIDKNEYINTKASIYSDLLKW